MEYALVARWLLVYALLWGLGLPIAARLFPRFEGRGAGLALPAALVVLTVPAYFVGQLSYGPVALAVGLLALVAASALAALDGDALRDRRVEPAADLDLDRRGTREVALVFVAAFLLLVAVRAVDPAVHPGGGEKFLDFGLLKSLARAESLPPEDIWFAGEPVAYYYGGHLITSLLSGLAFTPPRFAYNLALAGFYAMLVAAAYDLAGAVAASRWGRETRRVAGLLAAFFAGLASNLATANTVVLSLLPAGMRRDLAQGIAANSQYTADGLLGGTGSFSYWSASRVIPGTINEFPLFAWLNGDLHAHMIGTPFLLLAAALAFAYYRTPAAANRRRALLAFGAVPVVGGLQAVVDTWSFPTVFGLLWLAATFAPAHPLSLLPTDAPRARLTALDSRVAEELARPVAAAGLTAVAGLVAAVVASPFFLGAATATSREVAILAADGRSPLDALFLVHGAFVVAFLAYLVTRFEVDRVWPLVVGVLAVSVVASAQDLGVLLLAGPLLVLGWVALRMGRPVGFETVLVVAGAGLVTAVEFVYLSEQAGPVRMNTVFKTYMQVWVLWSVAAGASLAGLLAGTGVTATAPAGVRRGLRGGTTPAGATDGDSLAGLAVAGLVALLVLSTSVYGGLALSHHFAGGGEATLDATAFVDERHPGEAGAIAWLDDRAGQPTLVSAPATRVYFGPGDGPSDGVAYTWNANPAASLTGVPTVAGWRHEIGYRGREAYVERVRAVDRFFTGNTAERTAFLREYDVEYVWVGPAERDRYGDVRVGDHPALTVAHRSGTVTIYRVDPGL